MNSKTLHVLSPWRGSSVKAGRYVPISTSQRCRRKDGLLQCASPSRLLAPYFYFFYNFVVSSFTSSIHIKLDLAGTAGDHMPAVPDRSLTQRRRVGHNSIQIDVLILFLPEMALFFLFTTLFNALDLSPLVTCVGEWHSSHGHVVILRNVN
jgi:hypothetical protein